MKQFSTPQKSGNKGKEPAKKSQGNKTQSRPINASIDHILHLQQTIGNQAVQRMIESGTLQLNDIRPQPGDAYSREIQRLVERVESNPLLHGVTSKPITSNITQYAEAYTQADVANFIDENPISLVTYVQFTKDSSGKLLIYKFSDEEKSEVHIHLKGGKPAGYNIRRQGAGDPEKLMMHEMGKKAAAFAKLVDQLIAKTKSAVGGKEEFNKEEIWDTNTELNKI
jgi:hypothetical protein